MGRISRSAKRLLIVSINLNGLNFSLANHGWFATFANLPPTKLFCYTIMSVNKSIISWSLVNKPKWQFDRYFYLVYTHVSYDDISMVYVYAKTSLESVRDELLPLGSIWGPYLPFGTLHGVYCLSCNFTGLAKFCSRKAKQLAKPGNGTVHG